MSAGAATMQRLRTRRTRPAFAGVGFALCVFVLLVAFVGPYVAPHAPSAILTRAYSPAGTDGLLLGSDYLGHDVLSRVLYGGRALIVLPIAATLAAYLVGGTIGLGAAAVGGRVGELAMRGVDVLLVFPGLVLLLVLVTGLGDSVATVFAGIVILQFSSIARIVYAAALELSVRGFSEAAVARGERLGYILFKEILPNIAGIVAADFGPRLIASVFLVATLGFLGFGTEPPAANWALMITENRSGISINGLAVFAPIVMIATMTIGISLLSDSIARRIGRSDADTES